MNEITRFEQDRFGIFARTFRRDGLDAMLDAVVEHGFSLVQLNLSCAGMRTLPLSLSEEQRQTIASSLRSRKLKLAALSGTFNMIDPNRGRLAENLAGLRVLASACRSLGTSIVTICTGTRDPDDMWRDHPDNRSQGAWNELVETMREAVAIAEEHDVTLAFEPEFANVVDSAPKARKLLDEIGSPRLKVVLDVANLFRPGQEIDRERTIDEAFEILADHIALIHVKELSSDGSMGETRPGKGVIDFDRVFQQVHRRKLSVPVIMHGLAESDVNDGALFIKTRYWTSAHTKTFRHDGLDFRFIDVGSGIPFVYQHGLGGDLTVPIGLLGPDMPARLIGFDARGHGQTRPLGDPSRLSFDSFADDLLSLLDFLGIEKAVIGGISMGAGLALNFALRHPERTLGLVLTRVAWLEEPLPENIRAFPMLAELVRRSGSVQAQSELKQTTLYREILAESTDCAAALVGALEHPRCEETVEKLERIPGDCPSRDRDAWRNVRVPTLVLASRQDPIHPFFMGETIAREIPDAELSELTPKSVDLAQHTADMRRHICGFLDRHFNA